MLADSLATKYHVTSTTPSTCSNNNPLFYPSSKVSLTVNGQRVTANIPSAIRFHIQGTAHRAYLQKSKPNWSSDTVWNSIDHESIGISYKSLSLSKRYQISKLLHGWMNTGVQRQKIHPNSKPECPLCNNGQEDQDHILQCPDYRAKKLRYTEQVKLRSSIVTKCGGSRTWSVMHVCITDWLSNKDPVTAINATKFSLSAATTNAINLALQDQQVIGWSQAARGYLSHHWLCAQQTESPSSTIKGLRQQWMKQIILAIWNMSLAMWEQRNSILHANIDNSRSIRESPVNAQISALYSR